MRNERHAAIRLSSGEPWHLTFAADRAGSDLVCRVQGGDAHVGAVALAEWRGDRAHTRCLSAEGHKEAAIVRHAAHAMCGATRRTVTCVAGIHFDGLTRSDIDDISAAAYDLARRAATRMRDDRLRTELLVDGAPYREITSRRQEFLSRIEPVLGTPVVEVLALRGSELEAARATGFGYDVRVFAPLYLSNGCTNDCVYCGFRRSSSYGRDRLTIDEAVAEAQCLADRGILSIDLVTGEIPADPFVDYVCEATFAILTRTAIRSINLNLGSLSTRQYRRLRDAGAAGYHLYQETYDPESYFTVHRSGGKREMVARLAAPQRAADAGFPYLGLGVLLGLGDLRTDLASLAAHATLLAGAFPRLELGFSLPRVQTQQADPDYAPARPVSDDDFVRAMLFLRLTFPRAHLTLTTRERPAMRNLLLRYGVSKVSAGVSTAPGGYAGGPSDRADGSRHRTREQFRIADERSVEEIDAVLRRAGLTPVYG